VSFILKLGGGGGSEKTLITSNGQAVSTRASLILPPVIPSGGVSGAKYFPLANRAFTLPFPIPRPTYTGGQSLFGGRLKLPEPSGLVPPYRPVISLPPLGGGATMPAIPPVRTYAPPAQPSVPVVTEETVKTSAGGSGSNVGLWQGGLLLGPLLLGWLFGTKTIRHRRKFRRPSFRRIRRPSFRRLRRVRHHRRR